MWIPFQRQVDLTENSNSVGHIKREIDSMSSKSSRSHVSQLSSASRLITKPWLGNTETGSRLTKTLSCQANLNYNVLNLYRVRLSPDGQVLTQLLKTAKHFYYY